MFNRILAIAALSVLGVGTVLANDVQVATLVSATIKQEQLLGDAIWRCADTVCRTASDPRSTGVSACRSVAKRFGKIAAYTSGNKALSAEQLETCNQSAKSQ